MSQDPITEHFSWSRPAESVNSITERVPEYIIYTCERIQIDMHSPEQLSRGPVYWILARKCVHLPCPTNDSFFFFSSFFLFFSFLFFILFLGGGGGGEERGGVEGRGHLLVIWLSALYTFGGVCQRLQYSLDIH